MNKRHWIYMDSKGHKTKIAMLHDTNSGNFLVSCGNNVALAEFNVLESKSFSFFFDEELFKIAVGKDDNNDFTYEFECVRDVDTPLNRERAERKQKRKRRNYLGLGMGIVFAALSGLAILAIIYFHQVHLKKLRHADGVLTTGTILISKTPYSFSLSYVYGASSKTVFKNIEYYEERNPISPNGLPFYQSDEFKVLYERGNPDNHEIQYDNPTDNQIVRYQNRVKNIHLKSNSTITDTLYCDCIVQAAYDLKGLDGYADFTFQKTAPSRNKQHNVKTYLEFINTAAYREKAKVCEADQMRRKAERETNQSLVPENDQSQVSEEVENRQ